MWGHPDAGKQHASSDVRRGVVYPISARLVWGGGWLQQMGFIDFAGRLLCAEKH